MEDLSPAWLDETVPFPADLGLIDDPNRDAGGDLWNTIHTGQGLFDLLRSTSSDIADGTIVPADNVAGRSEAASDFLIQLYYQNFHLAHPVVLPQKALHHVPSYLLAVMQYIGAHYHYDPFVRDALKDAAYAALSDQTPRDGFKVQSMLLLAIATHAHGHEDEANQILRAAVDLALELGMDGASYARENSMGSSLVEESWRRTYWELYVVDGLFAGLRQQSTFPLYSRQSDLSLPCEEAEYHAGNVHPQPTLEDLRQNWSTQNGKQFSSFAYRIEAVRILGMVLALGQSSELDSELQAETVDACLAGWFLHLPASRREPLLSNGRVDEMLFQAQMIIYIGMIYLHRTRSIMRFACFHARTSCTRYRASRPPTLSFDALDMRSKKLIRAADQLSNLVALPTEIKRHSLFLICALAMAVIVHTAACFMAAGTEHAESFRIRVQLSVGAFNRLAESWPLARTVRQQVLSMYQEVVSGSRTKGTCSAVDFTMP
ncbi:hypothetical protein VTN77DRAFT_9320 [Rasamsonia byssochlamydoides]|uniref:uncharacterized protein n=1 Tax=Rasamsonia byssochlamydoides TaxID=89139 RepID=UPI00374488DA